MGYKKLIRNSDKTASLNPITKGTNGPLDYSFSTQASIQLPGAHGEDIVRHVFTQVQVSGVITTHILPPHAVFVFLTPRRYQTHTTYTCGEDGQVRAWKSEEEEGVVGMDVDEGTTEKEKDSRKKKRKEKKEKEKEKARFKPY